jgi:curli biogenesis system outer membrane secretion channel CsgG
MEIKLNILLLSIILLVLVISTPIDAKQTLVAVIPFNNSDLGWNGLDKDNILEGVTQLVTDKLVQAEGVKVIERSDLEKILSEQELGSSGLIDSTNAAELGRILGVDAIVIGTLTQMEIKEKAEIAFGPFKTSGVEAKVVLTGRLVDANTSEIITSFNGVGQRADRSFKISSFNGLSFGSEAFKKSALGKSIEEATDDFVNNIAKKISSIALLRGRIIKIIGSKLIIKVDNTDNLIEGNYGKLIRMIEVEELEEAVSMPLGRVKIISISKGAVIAEVIESEDLPLKGDIVEFE